jgi:hypothetical protein
MRKLISLFTVIAFALVVSSASFAAPDHTLSGEAGAAAAQAGEGFVLGAKKIAVPFIVVGKTVIDGVAFVLLKGEQGVIWVAEETIYGLKYVAQGAKFIIIQTAKGIRWVAIEALKAGEIILEAALEVTELIIEDIAFVLIKVEEGFVFVAKKALQAGKVVIRGIKYVAEKTAEGIIFVAESTANAIKKGLRWAADKAIAVKIRTRLVGSMLAGGVGSDTMTYFQGISINADASSHLRKLSLASYNACTAFNAAYNR